MTTPAPLSLTLRDAQGADMARVAEIYGHHVRHGLATFEEEPPDAAEMTRRCQALQAKGLPYLVAEDGPSGRLLGFAYVGPYRPRPAYRFTLEDSIYVDAEALGRGVGRVLLTGLIERASALGYRQMMAVIGDNANEGSIRLHESLGFQPAGSFRSVGFKLGRWVDVVVLQLALGEGDSSLPPSA